MDLPLSQSLNASGADFLFTELETAITFMDVAATTGLPENARRNHANARKAYDTVLRLRRNVTLSVEQEQLLNEKLLLLRDRLRTEAQEL